MRIHVFNNEETLLLQVLSEQFRGRRCLAILMPVIKFS